MRLLLTFFVVTLPRWWEVVTDVDPGALNVQTRERKQMGIKDGWW